jgi:hypothetical protein
VDCHCIKKNYDFQLKSLDAKTLLYQDFSDWMSHEYYIKPDKYKVEVKPPNRSKYVELEMDSTGINILTSKELGLGSENSCLPLGVYYFKVVSCGNTFMRYKAVTSDLECRLQCMLVDGIDPLRIAKLDAQIKSIHYNLEADKAIEANKIFKIIKREIDLIECDCRCCK